MASKPQRKSAIIIGAGIGGVGTAARLAKAGFKVTLLEKNGFVGGRCSLIRKDGYRWDQGPSLVLLLPFFREAFADLDTSMEAEGIHLLKCEPNYNIWYGDGQNVQLSSDLERMKLEIEKWEGPDGFERYLDFLKESHRHYELSAVNVLRKPFGSLFSMARPALVASLLKLHTFTSMYSRASKYFYTERLRRAFTFAAMYMGMSPYDAPGTFSLLQYTEFAEGIWYPIGGFNKIIQGLMQVAKRYGVSFHFNTTVTSINLTPDNKTATGVTLSDGTTLSADIVICNADLLWAYNNLLPSTSYGRSLAKRDTSCSSISFYWGLDRQIPQLSAHNIFLADEYRESFDSIFKDHLIPRDPSFYVHMPARADPSAAPPGRDAMCILTPVGHLLTHDSDQHKGSPEFNGAGGKTTQDWDALTQFARRKVLSVLQARTGIDISAHIVSETVNDPVSWKSLFNLDRGAILGLGHGFWNVLAFRPKMKHPSIKGLYFVGASTHPGTGMPIVLAGTKILSTMILEEFGTRVPWTEGGKAPVGGKGVGSLDRIRGPGLLGQFVTVLGALVMLLVGLWVVRETGVLPRGLQSSIGGWYR